MNICTRTYSIQPKLVRLSLIYYNDYTI